MDTAPEPPTHDPLHWHLSGKRRWDRVERPHLVELRGPQQGFMGQVLDLSRGGVRVAIVDPSFYEAAEDGLALVERRFPLGATVHFVEEGISRKTRVVRITPHGGNWLSLGCEFDSYLTSGEAVRLGLGDDAGGGEDAPRLTETACDE
jgi:hypothetical protein